MEKNRINERGSHTTSTEAAKVAFDAIKKIFPEVTFSPGRIEGGVGAKSSSIKFKHINNELYEMVVVHNGSKQEFKVFTMLSFEELKMALKNNKKTREWSIGYTDIRRVGKTEDLDQKYKV